MLAAMDAGETTYREVSLGPARVWLRPLEPWQWAPRREAAPGPASLCLELLSLAAVRWQGVAPAQGETPAPGPAELADLPVSVLAPLLSALQAPWLTPREEAEMELLARHLEHRADYPGIDCAACAQQEAAGEGPPGCAACPLPPLPASGFEALRLLSLVRRAPDDGQALLPALIAGAGPRELRLLLMRWGLIASRLERRSGRAGGPMLK
ncbi:MAG: hypothetical protein KKC30_00610 [Proteobacteria bacterium]|nr:hypothetical protein [Pseudomonadota bacterium]MBU4605960.1 hypothetical protein [Pseudomonadota bacterium]